MNARRETVVISNYWHNPGIKVSVVHGSEAPHGGIILETPIEDFVLAVGKEMTTPIWTRAQLERLLEAAVNTAIEKIKMASTHGVAPL